MKNTGTGISNGIKQVSRFYMNKLPVLFGKVFEVIIFIKEN